MLTSGELQYPRPLEDFYSKHEVMYCPWINFNPRLITTEQFLQSSKWKRTSPFLVRSCWSIQNLRIKFVFYSISGLVDDNFDLPADAKAYYDEFQQEVKKTDSEIPHKWLESKFQELGLDTFVQNYSFKFPYQIYGGRVSL